MAKKKNQNKQKETQDNLEIDVSEVVEDTQEVDVVEPQDQTTEPEVELQEPTVESDTNSDEGEESKTEVMVDEGDVTDVVTEPEVVETETQEPTIDELHEEVKKAVETIDEKLNEVDEQLLSTPEDDELRELRIKAAVVLNLRTLVGWTKKQCNDLINKKIIPGKTTRGNWVVDEYRDSDLTQWTHSQLLDYVDGELKISRKTDDIAVWEEIYSRYRLSDVHDRKDVIKFIKEGTELGRTERGVWIHDNYRKAKSLQHWTFEELRAALLDEIKTEHSKDKLVTRLRDYLGISKDFPEEMIIETLQKGEGKKMVDLVIQSKLNDYKQLRNERDGKDPIAVGDAHANLYRLLRDLFGREFVDFRENMNVVLDFFNSERNGIFSNKRRFLHWEFVPLKGNDLRGAETLFAFLMDVSRKERRSAVIDMDFIASNAKWFVKNEGQIDKIIQYFDK